MQDISEKGILACYDEAHTLLGGKFDIQMVSVHDPDEFVEGGGSIDDVICAYKSLFWQKEQRKGVESVGIGAKDWRIIRELWNRGVRFDWAMFACAPTLLVHPPELLDFVRLLKDSGVTLIDSAVFNGGFLTGGDMIDYRPADPVKDAAAFAFRDRYLKLCRERGLDPAAPAVEYAYRLGFDSVALNTSSPRRILQNAAYATSRAGDEFWSIL